MSLNARLPQLTDPPVGGLTRLTLPECFQVTLGERGDISYDETPSLNSISVHLVLLFLQHFLPGPGFD
jgi:hypothetical protein